MAANTRRKRIMAVASGGGHWVQLLRLTPALSGHQLSFVTVDWSYASQVPGQKFFTINDATRWNKAGLILMVVRLAWLICRERPDIVISTGAAPGYIALVIGRMIGARTVWVDSMANIERLSLSGAKVGRYADLWLTQWPHLARSEGPHYAGAVL